MGTCSSLCGEPGGGSIILSVLVSGIGARRFGWIGGSIGGTDEHPSDWNKREMRGSISSLDGVHTGRPCEDCGVDDGGGVLNGGERRKCRLGARYLGGGATSAGMHLLSVDGTG